MGIGLGTTEVGGNDGKTAVTDDVLDGGDGLTNAEIVGDFAVFEGNVEIDANENALAIEVEVFYGFNAIEVCHGNFL